jgi:phosphoenolpyruvate carboxylase
MSVEEERDRLSEQIHQLGDLLGDTIKEQEGEALFTLVEEIRHLAKAHRGGDEAAGQRLLALVDGLPLERAYGVVKAFATYFQLVNLAEEEERVRVLHRRARRAHEENEPMDETIAEAVLRLRDAGVSESEMQALLGRLLIMPVLTAHPTEAVRRAVLAKLDRVSDILRRFDFVRLTPHQEAQAWTALREELASLWQTEETRTTKPTVLDEVRNGLYYFESTLFDQVPEIYEKLELALADAWPDTTFDIPIFLRYGSWIGGDRDGNPFVTPEVTEQALREHKGMALRLYRRALDRMHGHFTASRLRYEISAALKASLEADAALFPERARMVAAHYPEQPYRQKLFFVFDRLEATARANTETWHGARARVPGEYSTVDEFLTDLRLVQDSLRQHPGGWRLASGRLATLIRQVEIFGFHLATLDVRQHAARHTAAIAELVARLDPTSDYGSLGESERVALLTRELASPRPMLLADDGLSEAAREVVAPFQLITSAHNELGTSAVDSYVVSMTADVSDALGVLWLATLAGCAGDLDIVPLFETVDALHRAPKILGTLFAHPAYAMHLERRGRAQQVMIGYSDSNKEAGYLSANWELHLAQRSLARTCTEHDIGLTLFHGRGGSVGRGGGPANRAILAQPADSVRGRLKLTEQGEVITNRYANADIAHRHLEQIVSAVLLTSGPRQGRTLPKKQAPALRSRGGEWEQAMSALSPIAKRTYCDLVGTEVLLRYFHETTPIDEIGRLNIGSRPPRRQATERLEGLRAIPWVFAWMQCRVTLPGWYGLGTAFTEWAGDDDRRWAMLSTMYREWPFFRTMIDNAQMSMRKADLLIAQVYARLAGEATRERVWPAIATEFERTEGAILRLTRQRDLLDDERWVQRSIKVRNPYIDPMNYIQVALLRRLRRVRGDSEPSATTAHPEDPEALRRVVLLTVNGIAAGLRNTG